jgi:hypothetical protein
VGWIGLKLVGSGLHAWRGQVPLEMPNWLFWSVMGMIVVGSLLYKPRSGPDAGGRLRSSEHPTSPNGSAHSDEDAPLAPHATETAE